MMSVRLLEAERHEVPVREVESAGSRQAPSKRGSCPYRLLDANSPGQPGFGVLNDIGEIEWSGSHSRDSHGAHAQDTRADGVDVPDARRAATRRRATPQRATLERAPQGAAG